MEKTIIKSPQSCEEPELLSRSEVAILLHSSLSYVDHLNDLPCYRLGKKKLFSKAEVLEYLKRNHVNTVSRNISKTDAIKVKEEANG